MMVVGANILVLLGTRAVLLALRADTEVITPVILSPVVRLDHIIVDLNTKLGLSYVIPAGSFQEFESESGQNSGTLDCRVHELHREEDFIPMRVGTAGTSFILKRNKLDVGAVVKLPCIFNHLCHNNSLVSLAIDVII